VEQVRRVRSVAVIATVAALVAASCGRHTDQLEIGLRRVALDLAFKDASKSPPLSPRAVARQLSVVDTSVLNQVPVADEPPARQPRVITVPARQEPVCNAAPAGANYDYPTYAVVKDPPKVGTYTRHNAGTVKIETTVFNLDLPYPAKSNLDISDLKFVTADPLLNERDVTALNPPSDVRNSALFPPRINFTMTRYGPSGLKQIDSFQYSTGGATGGDYVWLIKRETIVNGVSAVFTPTPPIQYIKLFTTEGSGSAVRHAGTDRDTNTALAVQSTIVGRESVDICGDVFDTFRVQIQENFVDLSKSPPVVSGNEGGTSNFWNIQFDHGLIVLREEVHSTFRGSTQIAGAPVPVTVRYDYTSTLDSLTPTPAKGS
jgi:hypothetical protein